MNADQSSMIDWVINALSIESTLFHLGQYCGEWKASTSAKARASFHLVLHGNCYLHLPDKTPVRLESGDAVFLLRDLAHSITSSDDLTRATPQIMQSLSAANKQGTGLACGFFQLQGASAELLSASLPRYLIFRQGSDALASVRPMFELLMTEAYRNLQPSEQILERMTELLFIFLLRGAMERGELNPGFLALARQPRFLSLLQQLLQRPQKAWTVDTMAQQASMSRASFSKHFNKLCGQSPARFLKLLRMGIAAQQLRQGIPVHVVGENSGYQSLSAFTRAFAQTIGCNPGEYQRDR